MLPQYIQYSLFYSYPFSHISGDNKSKFILHWIITIACLFVCIPIVLYIFRNYSGNVEARVTDYKSSMIS